ncbi:inositol monophosphatase family protein [uncultured Microscilla sp.]|uniref:inositol monophosphatase family protein n=1 Tax=uncultured Microscilla sp. TaxID=432653 RepID=UPI002604029F|nr:inositol monophosphatase family protein [uncultured Microscilla sp.]
MSSTIDLQPLVEQVIQITKDVGYFIRTELRNFDRSMIEYKGKNDLVSYVDKRSEEMLIKALTKVLPEAGFVSEEDSANHQLSSKEYHWVVDPLDGTTNFLHGLPIFAISIALMQNTEVIAGVVYEINRNECFYAWKDGGAYMDNAKIRVSSTQDLSDSLLATGFPYYNFDQMRNYLEILNGFMQNTHGLRRMGSAAVDLAYVACGRFEGFFEYNLKPWDVAAGACLVQEAGGTVTNFSGGDDSVFKGEIVASGAGHSQMLEIIQQHWQK